ncbi:GAD-like domain-containing protein [Roseateles sp.]|uniref:GAD-like domain-containing protein n=1 Tax=Roseateles sp. TaxID=1971397 RepID=UPI003D0FD331
MRDGTYSFLIEQLGQPTLKREVPTAALNKYKGIVPDLLLTYWESLGSATAWAGDAAPR